MTIEQLKNLEKGTKLFIANNEYPFAYNLTSLDREVKFIEFLSKEEAKRAGYYSEGIYVEKPDYGETYIAIKKDNILLASDKEGIKKFFDDKIKEKQKKITELKDISKMYTDYDSLDDYYNSKLNELCNPKTTDKLSLFKELKTRIN